MDLIQKIIDECYGVQIYKDRNEGYFVYVSKNLDQYGEIDEYETPTFPTIKQAIEVAYHYVALGS